MLEESRGELRGQRVEAVEASIEFAEGKKRAERQCATARQGSRN